MIDEQRCCRSFHLSLVHQLIWFEESSPILQLKICKVKTFKADGIKVDMIVPDH